MNALTPETDARLQTLLQSVRQSNAFYGSKLEGVGDTFTELPFTTKAELATNQVRHPPYGSNLTQPRGQYSRIHQTSGTSTGQPLRWLDTPTSWDWLLHCWQISFPMMGLTRQDRLYFPFSFGPFLGFWTAFEAASRAGFFCVPGGGMTSTARLRFLLEHDCTVVFATPTYALHLAELAAKEKIDLAASPVRALIVAGEPGGSIPATRQRIEEVWGARVFDHYGMTEVGPVAVEEVDTPRNLTLLGSEYIHEVLTPNGNDPVPVGEFGELVLTNLGRVASPVIRYRTGDLVKLNATGQFDGGILGRADDMLHVRGNNLYPAALEAIIRRFPEVVEYRLIVDHAGPLPDLGIEIESTAAGVEELVARAIRDELLFRVDVVAVPAGTLPRFELKARRVVHRK